MKTVIAEAGQFVGQEVTIGAWLVNRRSSGNRAFLQFRDGTGFIQGIVVKSDVGEDLFKKAKSAVKGSSVYVTGMVQEDHNSLIGCELIITNLEIVSVLMDPLEVSNTYGIESEADHHHLWFRSRRQHAVMKIRNEIIRSTTAFFKQQGFVQEDQSVVMRNAPEAASAGMMFSFKQDVRSDKLHAGRHLIECWMIEPTTACSYFEDHLKVQEEYVIHIIRSVLKNCQLELDRLGRDTLKLENVQAPFPRITYDQALEFLHKNGFHHMKWGDHFDASHKTAIAERYGYPMFITDYPALMKSCYIPLGESREKIVLCAVLIAPERSGEMMADSKRMKEQAIVQENDIWGPQWRKNSPFPYVSIELSLEQMIAWISGVERIHEMIPFPQVIHHLPASSQCRVGKLKR
ncbi:amino acid--tRNA ligase-related protein [Bacillus sp. B190/17]|uniref:Amino acid--tRNA ligase-related protein n=1 Tax=Bacillus lumedeiriae TaxID=3058829 RepID=A0ABW8I418_9BACI